MNHFFSGENVIEIPVGRTRFFGSVDLFHRQRLQKQETSTDVLYTHRGVEPTATTYTHALRCSTYWPFGRVSVFFFGGRSISSAHGLLTSLATIWIKPAAFGITDVALVHSKLSYDWNDLLGR